MSLQEYLTGKKNEIAVRWVESTLSMYVPTFFAGRKNRINNPIGYNITEGVTELYSILTEGADLGDARGPLEKIIKIQSVQDISPSKAVSFVFLVKPLVQEAIVKSGFGQEAFSWLTDFETRVDVVSLMAFDMYMECRERLHKIRIRELETGTNTLTSGICRPSMNKKINKLAENTDRLT